MLKFFACIGAPDPTGDGELLEFLYDIDYWEILHTPNIQHNL